jgi:glutaredoxin
MDADRLIVYKKEGCFKCEQVMKLLESRNIDFENRQMETHTKEVADYPYFDKNIYPIMKKGGKFILLKEILQTK